MEAEHGLCHWFIIRTDARNEAGELVALRIHTAECIDAGDAGGMDSSVSPGRAGQPALKVVARDCPESLFDLDILVLTHVYVSVRMCNL